MRAGFGGFYGLIIVGGFDDEESADHFFSLGEWTVDDGGLAVLFLKHAAFSIHEFLATGGFGPPPVLVSVHDFLAFFGAEAGERLTVVPKEQNELWHFVFPFTG